MDEEMLRQFLLHPILHLGAKLKGGCETKGGCIAATKPTLCTPMSIDANLQIQSFRVGDDRSAQLFFHHAMTSSKTTLSKKRN